ncbi:hypothetical protein AAVH_04074 [Aphelenchoides avenae]|nr:hypothetical protein AAVH_04074 [Aphelenchus avenae]
MTSNVQDPSVPATNALCKTAVVDTLEAALKHDGTESVKELFKWMCAKYDSKASEISPKEILEEVIASMDKRTYEIGKHATRIFEHLNENFGIDVANPNAKMKAVNLKQALSDDECRLALLFAVKGAHQQQKCYMANREMLELMVETAYVCDAEADRNLEEVKRMEEVNGDLEKKLKIAMEKNNHLKAQIEELEKKASDTDEKIAKVVLEIHTLSSTDDSKARPKLGRIKRNPVEYLERAVQMLKGSIEKNVLDEASTSNCTCLPVQLFLQMEKDNVDSALAALQREHNKLRDVYKCALEDRKRDKEEMDRLARKVAKLPVAESS